MDDERDLIPFDEPHVLGEISPDRNIANPKYRKCSTCGVALPADQLTVIKHRHAGQPKGHLRIYCPDHLARRTAGGAFGPATRPPNGPPPPDDRVIDTTYTFHTDTPPGKDPDSHSDTLHRYHRALWSRELPDGTRFDLTDGRPGSYLDHESDKGQFCLTSDAVIPTFPHKAGDVVATLDDDEFAEFSHLGYTIGGMMIWPGNRIENKQTINGARGFHPKIADRFDLTVECVRRHYAGEPSPLGDVLARYADFFALFESFGGFIEHFLLHDIVDGDRVRFAVPFDDFDGSPVPQTAETYRRYMAASTEFIHARNSRIADYARKNL